MKNKVMTVVSKAINWTSAVSMLLVLVLMFLPYWVNQPDPEGPVEAYSISDYTWFPGENRDLQNYFKQAHKDGLIPEEVVLNDEVLVPVALTVLGVLGVAFQIFGFKKKSYSASFFALLFGAVGLYGYLTRPVLALGVPYVLHVVLISIALVCGLAALVLFILSLREHREKNHKKDEDTGVFMEILGFIMPRIALILYLIGKRKDPESVRKLAWGNVCFFLALIIVFVVPALLFNFCYPDLYKITFEGFFDKHQMDAILLIL